MVGIKPSAEEPGVKENYFIDQGNNFSLALYHCKKNNGTIQRTLLERELGIYTPLSTAASVDFLVALSGPDFEPVEQQVRSKFNQPGNKPPPPGHIGVGFLFFDIL